MELFSDALTGLYLHIPYCRSKCQYCSFTSVPWQGDGPDNYLNTLKRQIDVLSEAWTVNRKYETIFMGGGTPTVYRGNALGALLNTCLEKLPFVDNPEISVETNPNTNSYDSLAGLVDAGVNRLSIGIQSFNDRILKILGRTHSAGVASTTVTMARHAGFGNINIDLIYGLPGQSLQDWQDSLTAAVDLGPEHLALYELTLEEGTPFERLHRKGLIHLPCDDVCADMVQWTNDYLDESGYLRYEISNYSKPGYGCRHNINYWNNGSYLGLGAGAVSCLDGLRLKNVVDPQQYMDLVDSEGIPLQEGEALSLEASFRESVIMGMRMVVGVSLKTLYERYEIDPLKYYGEILQKFIDAGLVEVDDYLRLTGKAFPVANQVLSELV